MSELPKTSDVVIIGGGVIGLAIARALTRCGVRDVTLIERATLGAEASSAAAGMLAPQAEAVKADPFFYLTCRSRDMYPGFSADLLSETGIDIELETTGTLYLGFTEHDADELRERYEWQTAAGLPVEMLTSEEARALEPNISSNVQIALKFPFDTQVENRRLVTALSVANQQAGVRLVTNTTVNSLVTRHGKVLGLETSGGSIATEKVVIAGGAWVSMLGDPDKALPDIGIEPVRGQMLCFDANPPVARHVIYSPRGYVVPRRDGRLLAGSTTEFAGFDRRVTAAGIQSITNAALEICPALSRLPLADSWAGLRPRAADGLPVLGPCAEIAGVFYATGHYRNGILLAPLTGEILAAAISANAFDPALEMFSPDRFGMAIRKDYQSVG
ncbi:MAG TPA: glycine oxidase ThiO [Pyrinomonadaceae bacterium]